VAELDRGQDEVETNARPQAQSPLWGARKIARVFHRHAEGCGKDRAYAPL